MLHGSWLECIYVMMQSVHSSSQVFGVLWTWIHHKLPNSWCTWANFWCLLLFSVKLIWPEVSNFHSKIAQFHVSWIHSILYWLCDVIPPQFSKWSQCIQVSWLIFEDILLISTLNYMEHHFCDPWDKAISSPSVRWFRQWVEVGWPKFCKHEWGWRKGTST